MMPVIYEVNLTVEIQIQSIFRDWLRGSIRQILELPGFIKASLFEVEPGSAGASTIQYVVQYQLESRDSLQLYFKEHATLLRQNIVEAFGDRVTAHRRILLPL